tara:strand:+ start:540 stop:938 length:399 start_codon:yes stop_codon:yes gene_type:complete
MTEIEFEAITPIGSFIVPSDSFSLSLHDTGHRVLMWASDGIVDEFPVTHLCQYTGIKDKSGNKIFEGDVVRVQYRFDSDIGHIEYLDSESRFVWFPMGLTGVAGVGHRDLGHGAYGIEILGSIYQHQESPSQ